ncbi:hypothetical protein CDAR_373621 [Caerostris darwini]|uniref:Ribosomal protein S14 n=1 Tax=Caerostris darwini TaxID=1538125 RepID=A0AAV4QLH4_9ARAC|nr:hypothetical protein CDAR_373621 [Caerostris darwini]
MFRKFLFLAAIEKYPRKRDWKLQLPLLKTFPGELSADKWISFDSRPATGVCRRHFAHFKLSGGEGFVFSKLSRGMLRHRRRLYIQNSFGFPRTKKCFDKLLA